MKPILYPSTETEFTSNGIGGLSDVISCTVEEEINGPYELSLEYPDDGLHADDIAEGTIIMASHDSTGDLQPFRVYRRNDGLDGTFTVNARHLSYDLSRIPVMPFSPQTPSNAVQQLKLNAAVDCPFTFQTSITGIPYWVDEPQSIRAVLHGGDRPMTSYWDCEVLYDKWDVALVTRRGVDRDISIRYGVNMAGLEVVSEMREGFNAVVPFYKTQASAIVCDPPVVMLDDVVDDLGGAMALDLTDEFDGAPTPNQLKTAALAWLEKNQPWITERSIIVSFVELGKTEDYKDLVQVQGLALGDSVMVYPGRIGARIGYGTRFRLVRAVYDVLRERYTETTLGRQPETVSAIVSQMYRRLQGVVSNVKHLTPVPEE